MKKNTNRSCQLEGTSSQGTSQQSGRVWVRPTKRLTRTTSEMADDNAGTGTSEAATAQSIDEMIRASLARVIKEDLGTILEKLVTEKLASQNFPSEKTAAPVETRSVEEERDSAPDQRRLEKGKAPMQEPTKNAHMFMIDDSPRKSQDKASQDDLTHYRPFSHDNNRLQRLEGSTTYDVNSWYQPPDKQLLPKFKFPEMTKYDRTGPPKAHVLMYMGCLKPMGVSDNMLAHLFQRSLVGNALEWLMELDRSKYPSWSMLADAFIRPFNYGGDSRVTRRQLEAMQQGTNESFTDYISRWRRKVREMIDRPSEEEQIAIIRKNLRPNYQRMMSVVTKSRLDKFIQAGTQVEDTLKDEISSEPKVKRFGKEHVNYVSNGQGQQRPFQLHSNRSGQQNRQSQGYRAVHSGQRGDRGYGSNRPKREFSKLNHPMSALLAGLVEVGLVTRREPSPVPEILPQGYNPSQHCDFHQGPGHLTDNCWALRHKIQNLLDSGKISMEGVQVPEKSNINTNPLPNHQNDGRRNVNYIRTDESEDPTKLIRKRESAEIAATHGAPTVTTSVYQVGESSQRTLTLNELAARGRKLELEKLWLVQTKEIARAQEEEQENQVPETRPVVTETPLFTINKMTPVGFKILPKGKTIRIEGLLRPPEVQHQTRTEKIYKPTHLRVENPVAAARGSLLQVFSQKPREEKDKLVVDQLRGTKANVSVWGLLEASSKHREVDTGITPEELVATVAQVRGIPTISFSDEDLPSEGANHNQALNIKVGWNHLIIPLVLVNNGSGVNIWFDNGKKTVTGEFTTTIQTGWVWTEVHLLAMDIDANFNLLLGRPWLHQNNAIASTVHQKVKFPYKGRIEVIFGDKDEVQRRVDQKRKNVAPVIEPVRVLHNYSDETVNILQEGPLLRERIPSRFDHGNHRVAYFLRKQRFFPGMGLGKYQQGRTQHVESKTVRPEGTYGLGYHPTKEEISQDQLEKRRKAQAKNKGEPYVPPSIDWSKQPRRDEDEKTKKRELPDDTLLIGINQLYIESCTEQQSIPNVHTIFEESELDDIATSSLRWMTIEEYIASKTQWANAKEYRAAFKPLSKKRTGEECYRYLPPCKKRMTTVQFRARLQSVRKKMIASSSERLVTWVTEASPQTTNHQAHTDPERSKGGSPESLAGKSPGATTSGTKKKTT
ncbi:hypothetical protein BVC80_9071g92 [Macleaya cordata]|uniref:Retrotransposon gag domain-containing protein n=1 Tax=Macleaya cordata TaxID=56857 RepID=A0A200PU87_MACCD|nr:hypothetical protein BVC80_9071g92 [Macleaya cordata]